jgi:DNA-binding transcriptional MerR regulator
VVAVIGFKTPALKELTDQQVRFAPPAKRREQAARARQLRGEVEPGKKYPYQFVCFRVTDYRPDSYPDLLIDGVDLAGDLAEMPRLLDDPVVTLAAISKQWNVSTKTVRRWRKLGLEGRRVFLEGKRQLGFKQSAIDDFLTAHGERVQRSSRFSQMTEAEREEVLRRARRMARACAGTLTEISRRIARRLLTQVCKLH